MLHKLQAVEARYEKLMSLVSDPAVQADPAAYLTHTKALSDIQETVETYRVYRGVMDEKRQAEELAADPDMADLAREELTRLNARITELEASLRVLMTPKDPNDEKNILLEIRAGTGGEEAALFANDLFRMYTRFAERRRWKVEIMSLSSASAGGLKEVVAAVEGKGAYAQLKYEGGVHRVQRVPTTEAQGRIHTSTATVAVLPEADDVDVQIEDKELDISIAASGGPGGQGVNTTNSAVQIRHIPTGMIVKCQDERSQLKNKAKALKVLKSRLLELEQRKQEEAVSAERRTMVGTAERAQKVRTYNYPQNRVTDHRIGLTLHKLDKIIEGDLDELIAALRTHRQAELLRRGD